MSQINHKSPKSQLDSVALNRRKPNVDSKQEETVGKTYGERRQKSGVEGDVTDNWIKKGLQWGRDLFLGNGNKSNNIEYFTNQTDRYEGVRNYPTSSKMARLEEGSQHLSKIQHPSHEKYVGFLNSVIQYLDAKKKV